MKKILYFSVLFFLIVSIHSKAISNDFSRETFYFILIDRFHDGNRENNKPENLYSKDRTNWRLYWGGDLDGIVKKFDYIKKLGVTGLWISPVIKNTEDIYKYGNNSFAAYHGYWGMDFKQINEHFGTLDSLRKLIELCKKNNIKIILDIVLNHTSPNGQGAYGALYDNGRFIASYSNDKSLWFHHNGGIDHSKGYDPVEWDKKNLFDLADLDQDNPDVDKYLRDSYAYWLNFGFDGFRIDTARYLNLKWLRSFSDYVHLLKNDAYIVGEWSEGGGDAPYAVKFENECNMDMLDFRFQYVVSNIFNNGKSFKTLSELLENDSKLRDPYQMMTFVDNHDMARFLSTAILSGASLKDAKKRLEAATYLIMASRGIPCIYYGTEQYLHNENESEWGKGGEPYSRQMMEGFGTDSVFFSNIAKLAKLRKSSEALGRAPQKFIHISDDFIVFSRSAGTSSVIAAFNNGKKKTVKIKTEFKDKTYKSTIGPDLVVKNGIAEINLDTYEVQITPVK